MRRQAGSTFHLATTLVCGLFLAACGETRDVIAYVEGGAGRAGIGASMVAVQAPDGAFWIDATEVTVADYAAWLDTNPEPDASDPICGWNRTFVPRIGDHEIDPVCETASWDEIRATRPNNPATCVDWCDAAAYCVAQGKRLCARTGGGLLSPDFAHLPDAEWTFACSAGGAQAYPYGNDFVATACNGMGSGNYEVAVDVRVLPTCEGGFPGLFDMSGNVSEWVDSCLPETDPALQVCVRMGGAYYQPGADQLACSSYVLSMRAHLGNAIGFRCCADDD